ncbi:hypothetical protein SPRG_15919 [Saprolegnia parasitica CBS 223.65]|uniref:SAM-dependent MTase RsmB/NOP-type domain-containing protein n=1 Tax=Saprolegnia parasitica (strain CBS 223.65) TaxID=695850 RepID=A0A067BKT4_SAPPC|nr:hypothetical protein SPRG_15919 [Saprolegnia parasitica CBS 223.65]KDO18793.1 hypothetical protein SPRG_15919 [Saprolegnia parasitica CBS 223.65]|eukprot:XP_012210492.1 hypothetical protein SPRG_15919 [Saprolegnia parasitica CBS 223.65]
MPSITTQTTKRDVFHLSHLQKELILAAVDAKSALGGVIVYSTYSVMVEENEAVVGYALKKRAVKLDDCGLNHGKPALQSMTLTRRFDPHVPNMDAFFVAKFKKYANAKPDDSSEDDSNKDESDSDNESNEPSKRQLEKANKNAADADDEASEDDAEDKVAAEVLEDEEEAEEEEEEADVIAKPVKTQQKTAAKPAAPAANKIQGKNQPIGKGSKIGMSMTLNTKSKQARFMANKFAEARMKKAKK